MTTDVNDFLTRAGSPSAKFDAPGDAVKGIILDAEVRDQTDFQTGEVLTWKDGQPRKQVVITLETDERDAGPDDDGSRRIYAKGQMLTELRKAVGKAGIEIGGWLKVEYTGDGEAKQRGFNPPKLYAVKYKAPPKSVDVSGDDDDAPF